MDDELAALIRAERLADAATLAESRGDARTAAELYERACLFDRASDAALAAGDVVHAAILAALASDDARIERALAQGTSDADRRRAAHELARRGLHAWAARAFESVGEARDAAEAWSTAGRAERAAELWERLGEPANAARELERAIARGGSARDAWALDLGRLLLRHGRHEAAVRALQSIEVGRPERSMALSELARAFDALGLEVAAADARRELEATGAASGRRDSVAPGASTTQAAARAFGRYEIVREVASTATARVLECVDLLDRERIALKIFAGAGLVGVGRDALARFEREVTILRALDHPSVVPLRAYLPAGPALALAWMPGGTLTEMLTRERLAPARAVEIAAALLDALSAAHRAGVIHRDVKPGNVLFDGAGAARLSDFGAAHLGDLTATATAGVIGTFAYMSPEQREGRPATIRSDVYAVGAVLREMLTGRRPDEERELEPSATHRDLRPAHDAAIAKLLALDPAERPESALAARALLLDLTWPKSAEIQDRPQDTRDRVTRPLAARVSPVAGDVSLDAWTGHRIRRVPVTARALARARAFAATVTGVDLVLRIDDAAREIWIAAELDDEPSLDRPLLASEARVLERALASLHERGIAHGHVDRAHVILSPRTGPRLRFEADAAPTATPDLDRLGLAALRQSDGR